MRTNRRCYRAETTRDCRHNHFWVGKRAYQYEGHT